jgi:hypothetical protein
MIQGKNFLRPACKDFEEDLVLYYYGECREAESHRVEEHLKECASCERFLEDLRAFLPLTAKPKEHPQSFWDGYYKEMQNKLAAVDEKKSRWQSLFSAFYPWGVPALGTAVVVVFALVLTFGRGVWDFRSGSILDEPPPGIQAESIDFFETMDLLESIDSIESQDQMKSEHTI